MDLDTVGTAHRPKHRAVGTCAGLAKALLESRQYRRLKYWADL
jgi:hypothetical protein